MFSSPEQRETGQEPIEIFLYDDGRVYFVDGDESVDSEFGSSIVKHGESINWRMVNGVRYDF